MKKEEFIKKWLPIIKGWAFGIGGDPDIIEAQFESDLNTLLTETAEKTRKACAEYYKSNCKDFDGYVYEVILHTPLT